MEDEETEPSYENLYPVDHEPINYLPAEIATAYKAANRIKSLDPNAYAVLLGRVLEKVCVNKCASGDSLYDRLGDLAKNNIIPTQLADMAHQLRKLRNIGAHADLGELTQQEIPILSDLCKAILEYVYRGPELIQHVQSRLDALIQP